MRRSTIGVSMKAGQTALTRTPASRHSSAAVWVSEITPGLLTQ